MWIQGPHSNGFWGLWGLLRVSMVTTITVMLSQSAVGEEEGIFYSALVSVSSMFCITFINLNFYVNIK